jgi:hypothetical protein
MNRASIARNAAATAAVMAGICSGTAWSANEREHGESPPKLEATTATAGSQGMIDLGSPNAQPGNDINTATTFTVGNLITTGSSSGYFAGLTTQVLGPVTFNTGVGTSMSFGNATLGSFASTSITPQTNTPGERSFLIRGNFTAGAFNPALTPNPAPTVLRISFTQVLGGVGAISSSATMAFQMAPEIFQDGFE